MGRDCTKKWKKHREHGIASTRSNLDASWKNKLYIFTKLVHFGQ